MRNDQRYFVSWLAVHMFDERKGFFSKMRAWALCGALRAACVVTTDPLRVTCRHCRAANRITTDLHDRRN